MARTLMSRIQLGQARCRQLVFPMVGLLAARRSAPPLRAHLARPSSERPISLGRVHLRVRGHRCRDRRRWRAPPMVLQPMLGPTVQSLNQTRNTAVRSRLLGSRRCRCQSPTRFHPLLAVHRVRRWGPTRFRPLMSVHRVRRRARMGRLRRWGRSSRVRPTSTGRGRSRGSRRGRVPARVMGGPG